MPNPRTKPWSESNPLFGSGGGFWPTEFQREQAAMVISMTREVMLFWTKVMMLPLSTDWSRKR
jgi:hypothetical protein